MPLYDVMSAYPVSGDAPDPWAARDLKMAMAMLGRSRHDHFHEIQRRHFDSTARKVGYGDNAEALLSEIVERTPAVVEQMRGELPAGFSEAVVDKMLGGLDGEPVPAKSKRSDVGSSSRRNK